MRILQLHCDYVEYTPVKKEISLAEPLENTGTSRFEELVVAFVTLEKGDDDKTISNASLARSGDLINITLVASESIYNATLEILNTTITMTESNNTAYANISVLQNSPNGPVEFNITAYDGSGNAFDVTQTLVSTNVIIDTVNPESSNLTIYSNNSRTDYAMAGHLLNITITANEALKMQTLQS